ncbi:MAG: GntR family transcriptional regulator, partial [Desulfobacterales bacterium]|nr:GntR family transcriptional regulator [Desulfobacterales bacterium]
QQLVQIIKAQIRDRLWKFDELIPSENELSALYNVSVGTVKKSLSVLVDEGVLYRRQGRGTYVAGPDFQNSFIRFFRYGAKDGVQNPIPTSKVLTSRIIPPPERVSQALALDIDEKVLDIKRIRFLEDTPLMVEHLYLPQAVFSGFDDIDISGQLLYPIYDEKYNTPIIRADEYLWPGIVEDETAAFLDIPPKAPVICIERIAYTNQDTPVEYRMSIGRGDRFRYHIELR